jgi:hypothetical protein
VGMTPEQAEPLLKRGGKLYVQTVDKMLVELHITTQEGISEFVKTMSTLVTDDEMVLKIYQKNRLSMPYICGYLTGYFTNSVPLLADPSDYAAGLRAGKKDLIFGAT